MLFSSWNKIGQISSKLDNKLFKLLPLLLSFLLVFRKLIRIVEQIIQTNFSPMTITLYIILLVGTELSFLMIRIFNSTWKMENSTANKRKPRQVQTEWWPEWSLSSVSQAHDYLCAPPNRHPEFHTVPQPPHPAWSCFIQKPVLWILPNLLFLNQSLVYVPFPDDPAFLHCKVKNKYT